MWGAGGKTKLEPKISHDGTEWWKSRWTEWSAPPPIIHVRIKTERTGSSQQGLQQMWSKTEN